MLQRNERDAAINMLSRSKATKTQQIEHSEHMRTNFLIITNRGGTLASAKTLLKTLCQYFKLSAYILLNEPHFIETQIQ